VLFPRDAAEPAVARQRSIRIRIADCGLAIADYQRESLFNPKSAIGNPQSEIREWLTDI
jgi:hypothetical protein